MDSHSGVFQFSEYQGQRSKSYWRWNELPDLYTHMVRP